MSETPLLGLPLLEAAQAQKHVTHNEALLLLDAAVHLAVITRTLATPPGSPLEGDRYLIAASPTGAWASHAGQIAFREAGIWRFATARDGWRLWVSDEDLLLVFDGAVWRDIQAISVLQNMALLGVNTTADTSNRLAISSPGVLLTHSGSDQRLKINKQAAANTGSLLYQTNFSGRAEMGLAGDDDFHVKVSANGSAWFEALTIARATGAVSLPNTPALKIAATRSALAALDTGYGVAWLAESGRRGAFTWVAANVSIFVSVDTQQGIYIAPVSDTTGASGAWARVYDGPIQARWFGAIADNATDNLAPLGAAIAMTYAFPYNKSLRLQAGTYVVNKASGIAFALTAPIVIEGEGESTVLKLVVGSTAYTEFFSVSGANVVFRNLSVLLSVPSTGQAVMFQPQAAGLTLQNMLMDGAVTNSGATLSHQAYGISFPASGTAVSNLLVENCKFTRLRYPLLKANASTSEQRNLKFLGCDFFNNYNEDLLFNTPSGVMDGIIVQGCSFRDGNGAGASLSQIHCSLASATNFLVSGCTFRGSVADAIHIEEGCVNGAISSNTIEIDNASNRGAIFLTDNNIGGSAKFPDNIAITGNTIVKSGTQKESGTIGILLVNDASAEVPAKRITVTGNTVRGFDTGLLSALTPDDSNVIGGNIARGCTQGFRILQGGLSMDNNVSDACDVGVYSDHAGVIGGHAFIGCTVNIDATSRPVTLLAGNHSFAEFAVSAGAFVYSPLHGLGTNDRFYGLVTVHASCENSSDFAAEIFEVTWDGTTFTATSKAVREPGALVVSVVRNSSNLAASVFCASARTTVRLFVRFTGMLNIAV